MRDCRGLSVGGRVRVAATDAFDVLVRGSHSLRLRGDMKQRPYGLSPLDHSAGDLRFALEKLLETQRETFGTEARLEVIDAAPLTLEPAVLDDLFRIAQEALSNARQHGGAETIQITLDVQPKLVRLAILDDGSGMSTASPQSFGIGIKVMEFRARQFGGNLSIGPGPDGGTLITAECPQAATRAS